MKEKILEWRVKVQVITLFVFLLAPLFSACLPIQAPPDHRLSLFASGNTSYWNPDGVAVDQGHVFIDYQNDAAKDGSDHKTSTIVEYSMSGQVLKTFSVPGHCDGLRIDPDPNTHLLWALSNENAKPELTTINPTTAQQSVYDFQPTAHRGGYDDLYFLNGWQRPFISASNPTLDSNGTNNSPSVYQITQLEDGNPGEHGRVYVTPILMGNASAVDKVTGATVPLNEIDPDSLSTDLDGDLVLINEDGNEVIFLSDLGASQPKVSRLRVGAQLDDTVWIPSAHGRLLIVDAIRNQTYWMDTTFKKGTVYTETTSTQSAVEQLDPDTGIVTIVATGFLKPTGLLFVPES